MTLGRPTPDDLAELRECLDAIVETADKLVVGPGFDVYVRKIESMHRRALALLNRGQPDDTDRNGASTKRSNCKGARKI